MPDVGDEIRWISVEYQIEIVINKNNVLDIAIVNFAKCVTDNVWHFMNWFVKVLYSEDFGELILQLYDLMDDVAKDRLDQIREKGHFEQEGYKKGSKKKGKVLKGVVNTMVGSVQREVKL